MTEARSVRVHGVVQGVGFRPFVFRLAQANALRGWVVNEERGVDIHLEGEAPRLDAFLRELSARPPAAAEIASIEVEPARPTGHKDFTIRETLRKGPPSVRISPDLPVCVDCLRELRDPADPRYRYPYINCTNCGPRYTVIERLPYDRANTTMRHWNMDALCRLQYTNPDDRRFHAQPVACPACGPRYRLQAGENAYVESWPGIAQSANLLREGAVVAIKGIGGYHLACDGRNALAVRRLRERKFRKEKPFAVMASTIKVARELVHLSPEAERLLLSSARPIVLAPKKVELEEVAPDTDELGVVLPYAPLHYLLFDAGAPDVLVMTSANRSSEPIAYRDEEALRLLSGIADAFLFGERPIARRVDDSVARAGPFGPTILRRSRGYAPGAVAVLPSKRAILALGGDLKSAVTIVIKGQAFVSQHIGDLDDYESRRAFGETVQDLTKMYDVDPGNLLVAHDLHPEYASTSYARELKALRVTPVQHHRAHIASVLAERQAWNKRVIGVSFDGTGYGDDGTIWGGEFFAGSLAEGFERVLHLRTASLAGGDAAARHPVQAAAGYLSQVDDLPELADAPFYFPELYNQALKVLKSGMRTWDTTSVGRLFDTAAALLGFVREISFEGQAAMWLENLARGAPQKNAYPFPVVDGELDFRPLLRGVIEDRKRKKDPAVIARAFQRGLAEGLCSAALMLCESKSVDTIVLSGGVFQNRLLLEDIKSLTMRTKAEIWTNSLVPPNDGGISLGQAAMAAFCGNEYA